MNTKKRVTSALITASVLFGMLSPLGGFAQKVSAATVQEKLFDASVLSSLHLQPSDFINDGSSHASATIGGNFSHTSNNHTYVANANEGDYAGSSRYYPGGKSYYRSSDQGVNDAWSVATKWTPSSAQREILSRLVTSQNQLQISARYDGWYDTQGGKSAGRAYVTVGDTASTTTDTLPTNVSKTTYHNRNTSWVNVTKYDAFILNIGGTKGSTGIVKHRNYARVASPEVYLKDITAPWVESITVVDNGYNKNYTTGDVITVEVKFSEPIRVKNGYSSAFSLNGSGISSFTVTKYDDYTQTVTFQATVGDNRNQQISKGNFSLTLNSSTSNITDLAGNALNTSSAVKSAVDENVIISGYVPRVTRVVYSHAQILNNMGGYDVSYAVQGSVKAKDFLYISLYFNQEVYSPNGSEASSKLNVKIGNTTTTASLSSRYKNGKPVTKAGDSFDCLTYMVQIPEGISDGSAVVLPASEESGYWTLTDNQEWLKYFKGNMILTNTDKKQTINARTEIVTSGSGILPVIKTDSTAPVLTLTDLNGTMASVYQTESEAASGTPINSYTLYVKSDEEVRGNVEAVLKYAPKSNRSNVKDATDTLYTGAYTVSPVKGMCLTFSIPAGIDSADYDIWLEVTAQDGIYNKDTTKFYLCADTSAPTVTIENDQMITLDGGMKAWEYDFNISDKLSQTGSVLRYRFDSSKNEFFSDSDTSFKVLSGAYENSAIVSGTIEYYGVDGMGNASAVMTDRFIIGDISELCKPVDAESASDYSKPPRSIAFTDFDAPQTVTGGTLYDYLVYRINANGAVNVICSKDGGDVSIPEDQLQNNCIIYYQKLSSTEQELKANLANEELMAALPMSELLYRCDNTAPSLKAKIVENHVGNAEYLSITAPNEEHPANITGISFALYDYTGKLLGEQDMSSKFVHNGTVVASISLEEMLNKFSLPSGEYTMMVTLTDANGHSGTYTVFENVAIIKDTPTLSNLTILNADETIVCGEADADSVSVDNEALSEKAYASAFADGYLLRADVRMRYQGNAFPSGSRLSYVVSTDGGLNWTEYTEDGIVYENEEPVIVTENGERYVVYTITLPLPEQNVDGEASCLVRVKWDVNPYVTDGVRVSTLYDMSAPLISVTETAVGSDASGWSDVIDYTNDYVKLSLPVSDSGICPNALKVTVSEVRDVDGNVIAPSAYASYVELTDSTSSAPTAIVKESGRVTFTVTDAWGNTANVTYVCAWIDDIETGCHVYTDADTELYTYFTLKNYSDYTLAAVPSGTELTADSSEEELAAAAALYQTLLNEDYLETESLATMAAARSGDLNSALRIFQRRLTEEAYDIICIVYDRRGGWEAYNIMTAVNEATAIEAEPFTSTVTNRGNVVNVVQTLTFNKMVAQLDDDLVEEIIQDGYTPDRDDIFFGELAFSKTIEAVIEDDNVREGSTMAEVYVTDIYGQIAMVPVDITGTTIIDYAGYTITYLDNGEQVDDDHIFGGNSAITLEIVGNDGISVLQVDASYMDNVVTEGVVTYDGEEYYSKITLTMEAGKLNGEGYYHAADIRIRNIAGTESEEYVDEIAIQYDTKAPVFVDAVEMIRRDSYDPGKVVYLFYDRREVVRVLENTDGEGGEFTAVPSTNGIYYAQYLANTTPMVAAEDCDGNTTAKITGPVIEDIVVSTTLTEGVDFVLNVSDENGEALEDGAYYTNVIAEIQALEGGKSFTAEPDGAVTIETENPFIFRLTDENGNTTIYSYTAPIDRTPPTVSTVQDNAGSLVKRIIYTITATDEKSGVAQVYIAGAGKYGEDVVLDMDEESGAYIFTTSSPDTYTLCVVDALGNRTEKKISSNSSVVGDLEITVTYHTQGKTNRGSRVSLQSADGRRIYSRVVDSTISEADYFISGNTIYVMKNGMLTVSCSDEIGNAATASVVIINIDTTAPKVISTVTVAENEDGTIDTTRAYVTFKAEGEDADADGNTIPESVYLLRMTDQDVTFTDNWVWEECGGNPKVLWANYTANPDRYRDDEDFLAICETLFRRDISVGSTYVEVTTNGSHTFYFVDNAGNITTTTVEVDCIDDTAPVVESVKWNFSYLTGERFDTLTAAQGSVTVENGLYLIDKDVTKHLTNQPVTVTITTDEPVVLHGGASTNYSTVISKTFSENGLYSFNLADKAGNIRQLNVEIANILKREIHISLEDPDDLILIEGQDAGTKLESLAKFSVYTYVDKVKTAVSNVTSYIDYGSFDYTDITKNKFSRRTPYTIRYTVWDEVGNSATLSKQIILCAKDDILVLVDGILPNESGNVYLTNASAKVNIQNYGSQPASVRFEAGQYNGAQMKTRGELLKINDDGTYTLEFSKGDGWYTLYVRTLYQDMYVVHIYVKTSN
ncbi:MAG: hypothetical protein IJ493_00095 [Clostridia bacterium]|nr:hypothetical protein [Clostridia bacterium]